MPRIRSLKPEFWLDRPFVRRVPNRDARMLYAALWNLADEHGRLGGDAHYIKGQCFPYEEDADLTPDAIEKLIELLAGAGKVVRYSNNGDPYLFLPNLAKHQRLEAKVPSRLPAPPGPDDPAPRPHKSAPDSDQCAPGADGTHQQTNGHVSAQPDPGADESARRADNSALLYGAGSREQVAGSRTFAAAAAQDADPWNAPETREPADTEEAAQAALPVTAQTILGEYLDRCQKRPPAPVIGQLAKLVKNMLDEKIHPDDIRRGMASWMRKGLHPATLPSEVNLVMNSSSTAPRPSTTDQRVQAGLDLAAKYAQRDGVDLATLLPFPARGELPA